MPAVLITHFLGSNSSDRGDPIIFETVFFSSLRFFVFTLLFAYLVISSDGKFVQGIAFLI